MSRVRERSKKANELCNNSKYDYKSTEDLCYMSMEWAMIQCWKGFVNILKNLFIKNTQEARYKE